MKALLLKEYKQFEFVDMEMPRIKADEVLVKIVAASVCGSDIVGIDGKNRRRQVPIVMGHEASGVIVEIGRNVRNYRVGDRVTFDSTVYCNECDYCKSGSINLCDNRRVFGVSCDSYSLNGAYCEYLAVPEHILYKLKDNITYQEAALIEPMSVALHAIDLANPAEADNIVLFGTGTIALFAVQLLKIRGCRQLIVVGRNGKKLELAKELGADVLINSGSEDVAEKVFLHTGGKGADIVYDAAGAQSTFSMGVASLKKGGTLVTLANLELTFQLDMTSLITKQLTIRGSCASNGEFAEIIELLENKKLRTDYCISKALPLSEGGDFIIKLYNKEIKDFNKLILLP